MTREVGQGPGHRRSARDTAPPRMRGSGQPAASYTWHVAPGGVLVVVDLCREGWRSVTNDAAGVVADLAELRPDLLARAPLIVYRDNSGRWDALCTRRNGGFAGFTPIGARSEPEAVAWVLDRHG